VEVVLVVRLVKGVVLVVVEGKTVLLPTKLMEGETCWMGTQSVI
jgi:hypothetical protein